jgi:hypothetical protein
VGTNTNNAKVPIVKTGAGNWAGLLPMPERLVYSSSLDSQAASAIAVLGLQTSDAAPSVNKVFTTGRIITVTVVAAVMKV